MIPLIKTHRSIGKSIIQIDTPDLQKNKPENPDTVVTIALEQNWSHVYVVDDEIGGFIPIYKELKKKNITLRFGLRISFVADLKEPGKEHKLIIFTPSEASYKALIKLVTAANTEGNGRLDFNVLHQYWHPDMFLAIPFYDSFLDINTTTKSVCIPDFRDIRPFVFLEDNDVPMDGLLQKNANEYARINGLETVWVKTIYYNSKKDVKAFQIKKLTNRTTYGVCSTENPNMEFFCSDEFCVESWKEKTQESNVAFEQKFEVPLTLFLPGVRLPDYKMSPEDQVKYGVKEGDSYDVILECLTRYGMKEKIEAGVIPHDEIQKYQERADYELSVLKKTRFSPYLIIVWSVMHYVRENKLSFNPGRGSAGGSLVLFLTGVTDSDPLPVNLFFQRFISENRARYTEIDGITYLTGILPDCDLDIGHLDRYLVFQELQRVFPKRVSKVSTVGTLTSKELVTEVCKIDLNLNKDQAKLVSDMIPVKHGSVSSPQEAYDEEPKFKEFCDNNGDFLNICLKLHNSISEFGKHASAVALSWQELDDFIPMTLDKEGDLITCYDQYVLQDLCIKLDLLGVKNTTVIYNVCRAVGIEPMGIPFDSQEFIYKPLENLENPWGLFQISGKAAVNAIRKIKPRNLMQLSDVIAIIRPGASEFIDDYANFNNGLAAAKSLHPLFDPVLAETNYTCLMQEQLMRLFNIIGFSLVECYDILKMIGKKLPEEMERWKPKIYERAKENNIPLEAVDILWRLGINSASYLFNLSHSYFYSLVAAQTVYLKNKYPALFFLESLKVEQGKQTKKFLQSVSQITTELPRYGVKLLPPSLLRSSIDFTLEGNNIRFGLSAIKGGGDKAAQNIKKFIQKDLVNKFEIFNAAKQSGINAAVFSGLAEVGAMDECSSNRHLLVLEYRIWSLLNEKERKYCLDNGEKYCFKLIEMLRNYTSWISNEGKIIGKESRLNTLRKNSVAYFDIYKENCKAPNVSQYLFEKELIGYSFSWRLAELFTEFGNLHTVEKIENEISNKGRVNHVGNVLDTKVSVSKKGSRKIFLLMQDETGEFTFLMMGDNADEYLRTYGEPKVGQIIHIKGSKSDDVVFVNEMAVQHLSIYKRVNDLRQAEKKSQKAEEEQ